MMLKIDFYLAKAPTFPQCQALCYQLTADAFQNMRNISILFNGLNDATQFSEVLWCTQPQSFLPHNLDQNKNKIDIVRPQSQAPLIQCNMQTTHDQLLEKIDHLIQIVPNNETDKKNARVLYKTFSALGHTITVHKDA